MKNNKGQFQKGTHWRKPMPWWNKEWLYDQYVSCNLSAMEIALHCGITENAIFYWLAKHGIIRRKMMEIRKIKHWGCGGIDNPMWNKKGELNPRWLGGITPERQSFYVSREWRKACSTVWKRDNATCQRCELKKSDRPDMPFHIHHIHSFANKELRAETSNLVLLCESCHHYVHSKRNIHHDYLSKI